MTVEITEYITMYLVMNQNKILKSFKRYRTQRRIKTFITEQNPHKSLRKHQQLLYKLMIYKALRLNKAITVIASLYTL